MTDDELGIAWYNNLSERERADWHYIAGSARPVDAWEAFKLRPDPIRNKLGVIPNSHFENEPTFPPKNASPLSKEWLEKIEEFRGTDKYKPGEFVGGY
jgi:hypothetical protein